MLPDVELRHLAALRAVVEEGSFARAATALGFTQSAVSQQIASLEKAIGMPVFDRPKGPRPAELTPAGELVLEHARRMLSAVGVLDDELDRLRRGITGRLVIGTFQSVSAEILPPVIGRMRDTAPEVDIRLFETDDQEILIERLVIDELDLAFTVDAEDDRLVSTVMGEDPFVYVVAAGDARTCTATPEELSAHPMIGQPPSNVCQTLIDQRLAGIGVRAEYVFRSQDNGAVQGMVRSGMGRAVMGSLAVDHDDPGIAVLQLEPAIVRGAIQLTRRRGRSLPPAAEVLTEIAADVCGEKLRPVAV